MSPRILAPCLPVAPLLEAVGAPSNVQAAPLLGVDRRTLCRWLRSGVPVTSADSAAIKAGLHPLSVWGDEWLTAEREYDEIREQERERARRQRALQQRRYQAELRRSEREMRRAWWNWWIQRERHQMDAEYRRAEAMASNNQEAMA